MPKFGRNPVNPDQRQPKPRPHPAELPEEAVLLRIFVGADDHQERLPLYEAIVLKAREQRLAGATVFRGLLGFGRSSRVHSGKILRLSTDLPVIIEIVDGQEKIAAFLPLLEPMMRGGLVTLERAQVIRPRDNLMQKPVRR